MVYIITSIFVIAYMGTMWYVELFDGPESYKPFRGSHWSRHWYFVTILTSLVIGCLVQFVTSGQWLFGVIVFAVMCVNNIFVYRYKKRRKQD